MKQRKHMRSSSMKGPRNRIFWLLLLSTIFLLPNFISYHFFKLSNQKYHWETYEPSLGRLRSVDDILKLTDSLTTVSSIKPRTLEYGIMLNRVIKWRFYHGYSHYSFNENWIAAFCGRFIWDDFSAIVVPDDILKYPMAACSQQSIVLMECLHRKGIPYRKVTFDHHFTLEADFDGWYFFDPDMEPDFSGTKRGSFDFLVRNNLVAQVYKKSMDSLQIKATLAHARHGKINSRPAPNAMIFQNITKVASKTLWLLPFSFCLFIFFRTKNQSVKRKASLLFLKKVFQKAS